MDILDRIIYLLQVFSSFIYLFPLRIKSLLSENIFIYGCTMLCCWTFSGCSKGGTPQLVRVGISLWGLFHCGARALSVLWCTAPVSPRHVESSWTKNQTGVPCTGRQTCNHRTTREIPNPYYLSITDTCLSGNLRFPATDSCSEVKGLLSRKI